MRKVVVIGGGAAGMMAAYTAARQGCAVTLLDHNEKLGKKLFITGKGRCNVTNAGETADFFSHVPRNPKFLYSAIYGFDAFALMDFFETHGLALKTERGNRVFPVSDHSSDVIKALERAMAEAGVCVQLQTKAVSLRLKENRVCGVTSRTALGAKTYPADAVIFATGGVSYESCGSDGSAFSILERVGHTVTPLRPALVGLKTKESYIPELMGLSLRNVTLQIFAGKKKLYDEFGELLFTHQGISGPLVLTASSQIADKYFHDNLSFFIDLKPALSLEALDDRILRDFQTGLNRQFKNALGGLLPAKLIPVIVELSGIDPNKQVNAITRQERRNLARLLKVFGGTITGLCDFKDAIITRGGISVKDVNPATMASKLVQGLYLCGEMLDVDAFTGGYNLQIAWSSGYAAGLSAGTEEVQD